MFAKLLSSACCTPDSRTPRRSRSSSCAINWQWSNDAHRGRGSAGSTAPESPPSPDCSQRAAATALPGRHCHDTALVSPTHCSPLDCVAGRGRPPRHPRKPSVTSFPYQPRRPPTARKISSRTVEKPRRPAALRCGPPPAQQQTQRPPGRGAAAELRTDRGSGEPTANRSRKLSADTAVRATGAVRAS
jgi:hypothetical protein